MSYITIYLGYLIILQTETWDISILNESNKISFFFVFYLGVGFLVGRIVSKYGYLMQNRGVSFQEMVQILFNKVEHKMIKKVEDKDLKGQDAIY